MTEIVARSVSKWQASEEISRRCHCVVRVSSVNHTDYQCPSARRMLPTPAGPAAMLPDGPAISAGAVMGPARAAGPAAGPANTAPANR